MTNGRFFGLPVALKGAWDADRLVIWYDAVCKINLIKLAFSFSNGSFSLEIKDETDGWHQTVNGTLQKSILQNQ